MAAGLMPPKHHAGAEHAPRMTITIDKIRGVLQRLTVADTSPVSGCRVSVFRVIVRERSECAWTHHGSAAVEP